MKVDTAARGIVVDCAFRVRPKLAEWLREAWCVNGFIRCAPHAGGWRPGWLDVLTQPELVKLTDMGFGVGLYQIFRSTRQRGPDDGHACADAIVAHCDAIGYPKGATLWVDGESFKEDADATGFLETWAGDCRAYTDSRGLYNGAGMVLPSKSSPAKLRTARAQSAARYALRGITRYWDSLSQNYAVDVRGPCLGQIWEYVLYGSGPKDWILVEYDRRNPEHERLPHLDLNRAGPDAFGGRLTWAVK